MYRWVLGSGWPLVGQQTNVVVRARVSQWPDSVPGLRASHRPGLARCFFASRTSPNFYRCKYTQKDSSVFLLRVDVGQCVPPYQKNHAFLPRGIPGLLYYLTSTLSYFLSVSSSKVECHQTLNGLCDCAHEIRRQERKKGNPGGRRARGTGLRI